MSNHNKCVVFIHGLGGSRETTWKQVEVILNEKKRTASKGYSNIKFEYYTYESKPIKSFEHMAKDILKKILMNDDDNEESALGKIHSLAKGFKTYMDNNITSKYENVEIIAHSMGGLISTRYLIDELIHNKKLNVKKVSYICTPFLGSSFADIAKKTCLSSSETGEMTTNSQFLKNLFSDIVKYDFGNNISYRYFFADDDDIIKDYRDIADYDLQDTLMGNHTTLLDSPYIEQNFKYIEKCILDEKQTCFINQIYSRAILNEELKFANKLSRVIDREDSFNKITRNQIEDFYFEDDNDRYQYQGMLELINKHSFSPHGSFVAEKYYVPVLSNENILEKYWQKIKISSKLKPYFYIGFRGSGKTLLQNIWLKKHFNDMEKLNIFHVRCDTHKIYDMMKSIGHTQKNLSIETYIDMQFLYIFLKYRDKKYNNKGLQQSGAESLLMKKINNLLNHDDTELVKGTKFKNLGDFLDKQSTIIYDHEVILRPKDRTFSYAIKLMKNFHLHSDDKENNIENLIDTIINNPDKFFEKENVKLFLASMDKVEGLSTKNEILKILDQYRNYSSDIQASALRTSLLMIKESMGKMSQTVTQLWQDISKYIQNLMLANDYKILKIIDGIDNIVIQDSEKDKSFFVKKLEEIGEIINQDDTDGIFYFIAMRPDTYNLFKVQEKTGYESYDGAKVSKYECEYHDSINLRIGNIKSKRYEAYQTIIKPDQVSTTYGEILKYIFTVDNINSEIEEQFNEIGQPRIILRNYLFLTLQVYFELKRRNLAYTEDICRQYCQRLFVETFFLKNKLYVSSGEQISSTTEDIYKVFPNAYDTHKDLNNWGGFCRIRILQLLEASFLDEEEIINKLKFIYSKHYIKQKIDSLLSYNLIITNINNEGFVNYTITKKGQFFLKLINNVDILYYLALDTHLPTKLVYPTDDISGKSYFSVFWKKAESPQHTGFANAMIQSILSFVLFLKYIHESEISILRKHLNSDELVKISFPIKTEQIDQKLQFLYTSKVKNYDHLHLYFKYIGNYEDESLKRDLKHFWRRTNSHILS